MVEAIYVIIDYICKKVTKDHYAMSMNAIMLLIYAIGIYFNMNGIVESSAYRLNIVALSLFLFHIGRMVKRYDITWKDQNPYFTIFLASSIIYIFNSLKIGTVRYARGEIMDGVQLFVWSMAGWFLVYGISQIISEGKSFIADFLIYVGRHTLPVLLLHQLSFKIITYCQIILYKEPAYMLASFTVLYADKGWWIMYSVVGVCVPLILYVIGKKIVFLGRVE